LRVRYPSVCLLSVDPSTSSAALSAITAIVVCNIDKALEQGHGNIKTAIYWEVESANHSSRDYEKGPPCPILVSALCARSHARRTPSGPRANLRWRQHIGSAANHHDAHHSSGPPGALCSNLQHALASLSPHGSLRALWTTDGRGDEIAPQAPGSSAGGRSMTDGGLGWHAGRTVPPTPPEPGSEHLATSRRR
jgi:hypothetical protein